MYYSNKTAILCENNGKSSFVKGSHHIAWPGDMLQSLQPESGYVKPKKALTNPAISLVRSRTY